MCSESNSDINLLANVIRTSTNVNCMIKINLTVDMNTLEAVWISQIYIFVYRNNLTPVILLTVVLT